MPRTVEEIEADIAAVKANPTWATNEVALNAITAFTVEKNQLIYVVPQPAGATGAGGSTAIAPELRVREKILQFRVHPSTPFTTVLESPLPFLIPTFGKLVASHSNIFELGSSEYHYAVDHWVSDFSTSLGLTSESGVVASDAVWQGILAQVCNLTILLNEKDPSSQIRLRPDFTGMYNNILVIKSEAKTDSSELSTAISELIDKFHDVAHLLFPSHCPVIPGLATSRQLISLHRIYYDSVEKKYCQDFVKAYRVGSLEERILFIVDIFKIAIWIVSQSSPIEFFHLAPNVRYKTRNHHHVTLERDGIVKEFYHKSERQIPMDIIRAIYNARLRNVEQGIANCTTVTITTIGRKLQDALRLHLVDKQSAYSQVQEAVSQLHSIGIAHCDICVDNVFVNMVDNTVFLGDLEYCQSMTDPPPTFVRGAVSEAQTGEELDLLQLDKLKDGFARL